MGAKLRNRKLIVIRRHPYSIKIRSGCRLPHLCHSKSPLFSSMENSSCISSTPSIARCLCLVMDQQYAILSNSQLQVSESPLDITGLAASSNSSPWYPPAACIAAKSWIGSGAIMTSLPRITTFTRPFSTPIWRPILVNCFYKTLQDY